MVVGFCTAHVFMGHLLVQIWCNCCQTDHLSLQLSTVCTDPSPCCNESKVQDWGYVQCLRQKNPRVLLFPDTAGLAIVMRMCHLLFCYKHWLPSYVLELGLRRVILETLNYQLILCELQIVIGVSLLVSCLLWLLV